MDDANAFMIHRYQVYLLEGKGLNEKTVDAILLNRAVFAGGSNF